VMAVTDPNLGARGGITAFLVTRILRAGRARAIPMLGGLRTYEVVFEDCRITRGRCWPHRQGFAPMQLRLTVRACRWAPGA